MSPRWGSPLNVKARSSESILIVEPTYGVDASQPSVDAPLGSTPASVNYIFRDGAIEPRPMLSARGATPQPFGAVPILGGWDLVSVANVHYPVISSTTRWATYGQSATPNGWSVLSYVSSFGFADPPALASTDYWDFTQIYSAVPDEMIAVAASSSYQSLYCTKSNSTLFSTLTTAPQARYVTAFDNYLVAFNIRQNAANYEQRVQWSDRGNPSNWTGGLSGFEDLLAMPGQGTRIIAQEHRLILFSDSAIWQGVPRDWPYTFSFAPLDSSVGCPYPWSIAETPLGVIFLSKDYQVYLLPKGGGTAQPIGQKLHQSIRNNIDRPERSWAVYDHTYSQYQLFYPSKGGSGTPQKAVFLNIADGSWAPQAFDESGGNISLTRGFEVRLSSSATTWGALGAMTWAQAGVTWADMGGSSEARAVLAGSSSGTLYTFSSTATSDNGTAVESRWRSTGLVGDDPSHQKTVREFRVDYQGDSASSMTVKFSQNLGGSFQQGQALDLPAASGLSQAVAYPYVSARFPQFEISSQGFRYKAFRMYVQFRRGGR